MFLAMRREFGFPVEIEAVIQNGSEVIVVLRKSGGAPMEAEADSPESCNPPGICGF